MELNRPIFGDTRTNRHSYLILQNDALKLQNIGKKKSMFVIFFSLFFFFFFSFPFFLSSFLLHFSFDGGKSGERDDYIGHPPGYPPMCVVKLPVRFLSNSHALLLQHVQGMEPYSS